VGDEAGGDNRSQKHEKRGSSDVQLHGANDPAYLGETDEIVLTQPIRDKAAELEYDPVKIYHWVRNHIEWIPTWGAVQNAELTLSAQRGNAMDIASLTLALLRASGIPSRYVHGTLEMPAARFNNWAGGFEDSFAAADYAASGGILPWAQWRAADRSATSR